MLQSNDTRGHAGIFIDNFKCIRLIDIWFSWLFRVVGRKSLDSFISRRIHDH